MAINRIYNYNIENNTIMNEEQHLCFEISIIDCFKYQCLLLCNINLNIITFQSIKRMAFSNLHNLFQRTLSSYKETVDALVIQSIHASGKISQEMMRTIHICYIIHKLYIQSEIKVAMYMRKRWRRRMEVETLLLSVQRKGRR